MSSQGVASGSGEVRLRALMGMMTRMWPSLTALLAGGLLALSFAPFDVPAMAGLGLIPLLLVVWLGGRGAKRPGWRGFGLAYLAGAAFWLLNLKWIAEVSVVGMLAVGLFLALYFAVWGGFAAGVGNPWRETGAPVCAESGVPAKLRAKETEQSRRRGRSVRESKRVLCFAAVNAFWWCGLEWVRGWLLTGFGWNGLGVAFHDMPVLAQSADVIGATGLSFLPVFVMAVVVQVGRGLHQEVRSGKLRAHWDFGFAMMVASLFFVYGIWKLHGGNRGATMPLHVLLVQLKVPTEAGERVWEAEEIHEGFELETLGALDALDARNAQRAAAAEGERIEIDWPDWVVWPESALTDRLAFTEEGEQGTGPLTWATINRVRSGGPFTLIFGLNEVESEATGEALTAIEDGELYNSMLTLPPGENRFRTYRKQHLVMFGETIPYREQLGFLEALWERSAGVSFGRSFDAGSGEEPLRLPFPKADDGEIALIPTICFEDTVPRKMRKFVKTGGQVIVNITNDGWFKESEAAAQHFANAKLRSIELRRPTVRCANTGVSAVIGVDGRVSDPETGERRVLVDDERSHLTRGWLYATAHVPVDGPLTLYARFGDWFAVLGLMIGLGWWIGKRKKRSGNPEEKASVFSSP